MSTDPSSRAVAHVRIGEILVDGPPLTRRERAALQAYVEHHLPLLLGRGDAAPAAEGVSPSVGRLGSRIVADVAAHVAAALPAGAVPRVSPGPMTSRGGHR